MTSVSQPDQSWPKVPRNFELSKFFNVERYAVAESFGALQWSAQLTFRFLLIRLLSRGEFVANSNVDFNYLVAQILDDPLKRTDQSVPELRPREWRSLWDVDLESIFHSYRNISSDERVVAAMSELESIYDSSPSPDISEWPILPRTSFYKYGLDHGRLGREAMISVDLGATDERILLDMKDWLAAKRQMMFERDGYKVPTRFSDADFDKWHRSRVLGYIDIMILSAHLKAKIPLHMIGEALFPMDRNIDVAERVRKVVKPLASFLGDSRTLDALEGQAAAESREIHSGMGGDDAG